MLEEKLLALDSNPISTAEASLNSVYGIDIDRNAAAASRLSLALLYLAATTALPPFVDIHVGDSLETFAANGVNGNRLFDAVMVNPPFIRRERQPADLRKAISSSLQSPTKGKTDTYIAFLETAIRHLRPGGFGFFVLPQVLATSDTLEPLRKWIRSEAWIHLVADLSAVRIFRAGVYVILLVIEKKRPYEMEAPSVSFIRCISDSGAALEDFLDGKYRRTPSYSIFKQPQDSLERENWSTITPEESHLRSALDTMPKLASIAVVRQGAITGADAVFIRSVDQVPQDENSIYQSYLPDRMISRFRLPDDTGKRIF